MTDHTALDRLAARMGIVSSYNDPTGTRHDAGPGTKAALLRAMGLPGTEEEAAEALERMEAEEAARRLPHWEVVEAGAEFRLDALSGQGWSIELEDTSLREGEGAAIGVLPVGIHLLRSGAERCWLLCAPARLPLPPRLWGVTLPLYGLAAEGIGSYADLAEAVRALNGAGAAFVGINPIHAGFPDDPDAASPYSPSSRRRLSTLHIEAGARAVGGDLVDYPDAKAAQEDALRTLWASEGPPDSLDDWIAAEGTGLAGFALHQALSTVHGPYWGDWPEEFQDSQGDAVATFARENAVAIRYHCWLQWLAETQLAAVHAASAGMAMGLYVDLAVGTHPHGAETWANPGFFAQGVSQGAPPDAFSADGQSWGLAPLRPDALARDGFRYLAGILRAQLKAARLLRIDHILGFERAFWVPVSGEPGGYVEMPKRALMAVARIEASRVGATIVGEDLGNVPEKLRDDMEASGLLGCRVAMFERDWEQGDLAFLDAPQYDEATLTSFSTHDLPTWEGWKAGRDLAWRRDLGSMDAETHSREAEGRARETEALTQRIGGSGVRDLHAFLARSPARLVAVQIEDVLGRVEQANLPGTIDEHPNWRRRLGVAPAALGEIEELRATAQIMQQAGR